MFNRFNILTILKPTKYSIGGIREQEKDMLVNRLRPPPIRMGRGVLLCNLPYSGLDSSRLLRLIPKPVLSFLLGPSYADLFVVRAFFLPFSGCFDTIFLHYTLR